MTNEEPSPYEERASSAGAARPSDDRAWVRDLPAAPVDHALTLDALEPGSFVFSDLFAEVNEHTRRAEAAAAVRDVEMLYQAHCDIVAAGGSMMHYRSLATQLAVTRSTGARLWEKRLSNAVRFKTMFLPVFDHMRAGELPLWIEEVIPEEGFRLDDETQRESYIDFALALALEPSMTAAKLRKQLRARVEGLFATDLEERSKDHYRWATAGGVRVADAGEGLAVLSIILPAVKAYAVKDRLNRIAKAKRQDQRALQSINEQQTLDAIESHAAPTHAPTVRRVQTVGELEHETAADLLAGSSAGDDANICGEVRVTVPALTLLTNGSRHTIDDLELLLHDVKHSGEGGFAIGGNAWLEGFGAVPVDQVRQVAGSTDTWLRMFVDPCSRGLIATDAYQAPKALRDFLRFRDPECRFPGCTRAAEGCDKDHTIPYRVLRETSPENLAHLCRYHHLTKHRAGWKMKQLGQGVIEWISPSGKRVRTDPYRVPLQAPADVLAPPPSKASPATPPPEIEAPF